MKDDSNAPILESRAWHFCRFSKFSHLLTQQRVKIRITERLSIGQFFVKSLKFARFKLRAIPVVWLECSRTSRKLVTFNNTRSLKQCVEKCLLQVFIFFSGDHVCLPGQFKCTWSYCIDESEVCDNIIDCKQTYVDESNCSKLNYFLPE